MLKRLELVGFKSFADKTAFDFPAGLTAVVGPNGSGKSNIVDAVRWVLGEQSAKSLRGGDMTDVIFNGSSSRKSLGLAEVIMTFDNSRGVLATDAEEVQIGRRVYRSGESEYLVNGQVCRLKDVKNLFLGSGAGADAYCIIQQGQVEVMLQSSTRERRTIFEEAAGISRFKARKTETLRRLERVDQNVQRLRDIIDEVEKQLRSVKLQAAKAQRYQEYSERLKVLRVGLGLQEYQQLSDRLRDEQIVLDALRAELQQYTADAEAWEVETSRLEAALQTLDEEVRQQEGLLASARQQIAAAETTLTHEGSLSAELEKDLAETRQRLAELNAHVATLTATARRATDDLREAEGEYQRQREEAMALEDELKTAAASLAQLHSQEASDKTEHVEQMRQAAHLQNDAVVAKAQLDNLRRERERLRHKTEQATEHLASLDLELQELTGAEEVLQSRLGDARQALADQRKERDRLRQLHDETTQLIADLRAERSGLASRIEVLERLERSHEGLGTGVREMVELLEQADRGPWQHVLGMVANFFDVRREYAPLIDLALGETAQRFLVRDMAALDEALRGRGQQFTGRVSFVALRPARDEDNARAARQKKNDGLLARSDGQRPTVTLPARWRMPPLPDGVTRHPGFLACAGQLVNCEHEELGDLPLQVLGSTLVVRDLAAARTLATAAAGYRFVTLQGELLEADGTLTVGTHHAETGILSRKSELRELREQAAVLDRRIADADADLVDLRERMTNLGGQAERRQEEIDVLAEQDADLRSRIVQHRKQREGLHEEVVLSQTEISGLEQDIVRCETTWREAREHVTQAEARVRELEARMEEAKRAITTCEQARQERMHEHTLAKVALGKVEERLAGLRAQQEGHETRLRQRQQERGQVEQHLTGVRQRVQESQRAMLQASATLAVCYLDKEAAERCGAERGRERDLHRQQRQQLAERVSSVRGEWQGRHEQAHARELSVNDLRHRRDTLVARLQEDYQIDLASFSREPPASAGLDAASAGLDAASGGRKPPEEDGPSGGLRPPLASEIDPDEANKEIAELRSKLNRLGSVNLDSLQELAELEGRAGSLQAQYDDLTSAKRALEEIIARINGDSRRLFTETFETIRTHFQELFRKMFGGGQADIVLEDPNDVLESGIEVIARPPGKELSSISLMSGGEKTMTAVALLMAIFRSKPSPFCILDEVDAALDEANIGRYTAVLREFLDRSQFIIITHQKRTMAAADILYGITMQESGISKRVAVRFEDWTEDGRPPSSNGKPEGVAVVGKG